jgi:hypothetical protein
MTKETSRARELVGAVLTVVLEPGGDDLETGLRSWLQDLDTEALQQAESDLRYLQILANQELEERGLLPID